MSAMLLHLVRQGKESLSSTRYSFSLFVDTTSKKRRTADATDVAPSTLPLARRRFDPILQSTGASQMSKTVFKRSLVEFFIEPHV